MLKRRKRLDQSRLAFMIMTLLAGLVVYVVIQPEFYHRALLLYGSKSMKCWAVGQSNNPDLLVQAFCDKNRTVQSSSYFKLCDRDELHNGSSQLLVFPISEIHYNFLLDRLDNESDGLTRYRIYKLLEENFPNHIPTVKKHIASDSLNKKLNSLHTTIGWASYYRFSFSYLSRSAEKKKVLEIKNDLLVFLKSRMKIETSGEILEIMQIVIKDLEAI